MPLAPYSSSSDRADVVASLVICDDAAADAASFFTLTFPRFERDGPSSTSILRVSASAGPWRPSLLFIRGYDRLIREVPPSLALASGLAAVLIALIRTALGRGNQMASGRVSLVRPPTILKFRNPRSARRECCSQPTHLQLASLPIICRGP